VKHKTKKKRNRGFTLVEVLVAAAILSLVVTPILSSFVAIARINAKSRRRLSATTIANGVMESVKGFELAQIAKECNYPEDGFNIIPGGYTTTDNVTELQYGSKTTPATSKSVEKKTKGYVFNGQASGNYAFRFLNVQMDGTTYDVVLTYTRNDTYSNKTVDIGEGEDAYQKSTKEIFGPAGVRVLTYYDIRIEVYQDGHTFTSQPLVTLTGSKADYYDAN
jgi:prepilin-type N-terminal cleavage/methylation domain-containing protein